MFLKAGAISLALLLASRLLGLVRESALAAAFGTSGMADVAVLMLSLPDWLAGLVASGTLAYVLVPAWARRGAAGVAATQRRVARWALYGGAGLAVGLIVLRDPAAAWLAGGLAPGPQADAAGALIWSSLALPAALLGALWATRLQHERDFLGLYSANLVVNLALIATIAAVALWAGSDMAVCWLGGGLLLAMGLRLAWLWHRQVRSCAAVTAQPRAAAVASLPPLQVWLWAALSAGLPLALPFAARSIASQSGEGGLSTFHYAWKLVELPLLLAIQLVATLAFPAIAKAFGRRADTGAMDLAVPIRSAFVLAWTLACAASTVSATAIRACGNSPQAATWPHRATRARATASMRPYPNRMSARAGAPNSKPAQAAQARMKAAVVAYALAVAVLIAGAALGVKDGQTLMWLLNALFAAVSLVMVAALGPDAAEWVPWKPMLIAAAALALVGLPAAFGLAPASGQTPIGLAAAVLGAGLVLGLTWLGSGELRAGLRR
ncbi:MAG: hypothetical protein EOO54_17550 [Haliea sp.]|nr:MAG: hypothetical protein EOO54_17550 [Haliea sp.]